MSQRTTINEIRDLVKNQWQVYQLSDIPKEWHTKETENAKKSQQNQNSYWRNVESSWLDLTPKDLEEKTE